MKLRSARRLPLLCAGALVLLFASALAGPDCHYTNREGFSYYEIWWREARADHETAFLLHGGPPREHPWTRPGNAKAGTGEPEEDPLLQGDLDDLLEPGGGGGGMDGLGGGLSDRKAVEHAQRDGRHRDSEAPEGTFYDYSPNLGVVDIPDGVRRTEDGRFGHGVAFDGANGIHVRIGAKGEGRTMDGWFKPASLPDGPVLLLGAREGAQLHLLPDGRLQASWFAHPRDETRTRITSEATVAAGEWSHIACYLWLSKTRFPKPELRIGLNGRTVAKDESRNHRRGYAPLVAAGMLFSIGEDPDGEAVFTGVMDDIRVTTRRRYCVREDWSGFDPAEHPRPVPFGPPVFEKDRRVLHIDFESRDVPLCPAEGARIEWDPGAGVAFADYQVDAPFGKALLVDPAMGFPRVSIEGMDHRQGALELWLQPVNWDNNSVFGEGMGWGGKYMSLARFRGRDTRSGKIVTFMEARFPRASMFRGGGWLQPGTWSHFVWTWSPEYVHQEDSWGKIKKGDPIGAFRAICFGELQWRAVLSRNVRVLDHVEPLYIEFGVPGDDRVYHGQRPAFLIDEVVLHADHVPVETLKETTARWRAEHHPAAK